MSKYIYHLRLKSGETVVSDVFHDRYDLIQAYCGAYAAEYGAPPDEWQREWTSHRQLVARRERIERRRNNG